MLKIDSDQVIKFEKTLRKVSDAAIPIAIQKTLEDTGFHGRKKSIDIASQKMTLRNKHTEKTILVDKTGASVKDINKKKVILGSTEEYMRLQEFGGVKKSSGKAGVAIPTASASGEGNVAKPKKRLPRPTNLLNQVRLNRKGVNGTRRQRNVAKVKQAKAAGDKFVYLETTRSKGIYRITGTKKRPVIKMIWDLSRRSYQIPKKPWLLPASIEAMSKQPNFYAERLAYQLRRLGFKA